MATMVFMTVGPMGFLVGFAVSEVIGYLSTIIAKEAPRMGKAIVKCVKERTGKPGKSHLPLSRVTLLTSLCKPGERANFQSEISRLLLHAHRGKNMG